VWGFQNGSFMIRREMNVGIGFFFVGKVAGGVSNTWIIGPK